MRPEAGWGRGLWEPGLASSIGGSGAFAICHFQFAVCDLPFVRENKHTSFKDSPLTQDLKAKDVCIYGPGDLNKIGKEGKTSWDSFSYAIQMGHNVWSHIDAVQEANRQYDAGRIPKMLVQEQFDRILFKDVVEAVFATNNRAEANAVIEEFSKFWMAIPGTRGAVGKKTVNAGTYFDSLFEVDNSTDTQTEIEELDETKLESLLDEQN